MDISSNRRLRNLIPYITCTVLETLIRILQMRVSREGRGRGRAGGQERRAVGQEQEGRRVGGQESRKKEEKGSRRGEREEQGGGRWSK
jgi:hypothetical protein